MDSTRLMLAMLAAALVVGISWWFYNNFELVPIQTRGAPSAEAQANPLLAAERFLSRMHISAESVQGRKLLNQFPATGDTLVILGFGDGLTVQKSKQLLDWVRAGGNLVFPARALYDDDVKRTGNPLVDTLHIAPRLSKPGPGQDAQLEPGMDPETLRKRMEAQRFDLTHVNLGGSSADVGFERGRFIQDLTGHADLIAKGSAGPHLIQIHRGKGTITILSDMDFMTNPEGGIEKYDNAYLLFLLVRGAPHVWLVYSAHYAALPTLLWKWAPQFCVAALLLLAAWIWWLRNPFGPGRALGQDSRRNILEQLLASANFEWAIDKGRMRVEGNRALVLAELRRKHPRIRQMSHRESCAFLAKASGMRETDVALALYENWKGEREFIQLTSNLQQLHEAL